MVGSSVGCSKQWVRSGGGFGRCVAEGGGRGVAHKGCGVQEMRPGHPKVVFRMLALEPPDAHPHACVCVLRTAWMTPLP